jgi:hypothetical protein
MKSERGKRKNASEMRKNSGRNAENDAIPVPASARLFAPRCPPAIFDAFPDIPAPPFGLGLSMVRKLCYFLSFAKRNADPAAG